MKLLDKMKTILFGVIISILIFCIIAGIVNISIEIVDIFIEEQKIEKYADLSMKVNAIADSSKWDGFSPYEVYIIVDDQTGVCYAITETGNITPMYTADGKLKVVNE